MKEQAKGFLVFVTIFSVVMGFIYLTKDVGEIEQKEGEQEEFLSKSFEVESWDYVRGVYYGGGYPADIELRERFIRDYLHYNTGLDQNTVENLAQIAKKETSGHEPTKMPRTEVKHCRRSSGGYYAVELTNGYQADCIEGDTQVHTEKSIGVFQILPSTFKITGCEGDISDIERQLDCAGKIFERSGYKAWLNASTELGLI